MSYIRCGVIILYELIGARVGVVFAFRIYVSTLFSVYFTQFPAIICEVSEKNNQILRSNIEKIF